MKQELSVDLLRRLKLNGYTLLLPREDQSLADGTTYTPSKEPISQEDLDPDGKAIADSSNIPHSDATLVIDLVLAEDPTDNDLKGYVILPDEELASDLYNIDNSD